QGTWTVDHRRRALAKHQRIEDPERRAPAGVVQPAEPLQLGQPGDQSQSRDVRAHHDDAGNAADPAVWIEVRVLMQSTTNFVVLSAYLALGACQGRQCAADVKVGFSEESE